MLKYGISHYNNVRGENELVIYNLGERTGTNKYGFEITVENGRVVSCGGNDNIIPADGFVVSGHGAAAQFLADKLCVGTKISILGDEIIIETDKRSHDLLAETQINEIEVRLNSLHPEKDEYNLKAAKQLLKDAKSARENGDYALVKSLTQEAYYLTSQSIPNEIRQVWHRPNETSLSQVEETVKRFADAGFNAMLIETNYGGYANALRCVKPCLPARKGYENGFDVIDAFISMGKKYGVKIHCWFESFFCGHSREHCTLAEMKPQWLLRRKDGSPLLDGYDCFYFLNPVLKEVRDYLLDSVKELLDNYDFYGMQLDYIRYPVIRGIEYAAGFDEYTKAEFYKDSGIDIDKIETTECDEWKRFTAWCGEKVTLFVKSVYDLIKDYRDKGRSIVLSTAVVGDPIEATETKCQNWQYWVKQGWLDAIYPMAYYNDPVEVEKEIRHMVESYGEAPNVSGLAPMFNGLPPIEATKQVEACRRAGASGVAFFSASCFRPQELQQLKQGVFRNK